jgi:cobalamin biosynthesis Co2+ chelatase CbiK
VLSNRKYLQQITISTGRPQLQFVLKDKGNYYQLSLQYLVHGAPVKSPVEDDLFFVCDGTQYYLLASLRDAAMVQWMSGFDNLITVLKKSFPAFEREILQRIEAMYMVVRK